MAPATLNRWARSLLRRSEAGNSDINCGLILDSELSVEQVGERIFEHILEAASGVFTKSELLGLGDHEFVPWHLGTAS
ncbi:UxaA family hydrolase [Pseudomonas congelans]|uniref:UxaA family hydrolase n=1 Tax=Pseudomonas congelans TaxID=200452 RepID=UPI001EFF6185|nr:UxaA family hydrolase [Pseudomonas congelans]